ncbi:hypothetical protein [Methylobacterium nodulans]|uniref:hypothetical protein n=1 Tax=Methylobacterium nodulans TaxID=114616 RepID=UPI0012EDF1DB|nr:hypothetical protein [Methylobacterium nodulans]
MALPTGCCLRPQNANHASREHCSHEPIAGCATNVHLVALDDLIGRIAVQAAIPAEQRSSPGAALAATPIKYHGFIKDALMMTRKRAAERDDMKLVAIIDRTLQQLGRPGVRVHTRIMRATKRHQNAGLIANISDIPRCRLRSSLHKITFRPNLLPVHDRHCSLFA